MLSGLIAHNPRIVAGCRSELIPPDIGDAAGEGEEESLHSNYIYRVDSTDSIYIRSCEPTARERSSEVKEVSLDRDYIHGINPIRARSQARLAWSYGITAPRKGRQRVVT